MKADTVIAAFRAFMSGDMEHGHSVVRQLAASEQKAGRSRVAERLERLFQDQMRQLKRLQLQAPSGIVTFQPVATLDSLILPLGVRSEVDRVVAEWGFRETFQEHGLPVNNTVFLSGPSGNGKTVLAEAIATAIRLPLAVVDYPSLIDSHLGVTGKHLGEAIDWLSSNPAVLLIDEADAICEQRRAAGNPGDKETARIVNTLLMKLDSLSQNSLVIFATNFPEVIDSALRRRVSLFLELPTPGEARKQALIDLLLERWTFLSPEDVAGAGLVASFAEVEQQVMAAARSKLMKGTAE